ncbi:protein terminal ear1 homolog [Magnolia sinica]|uniref:protein terminal ear1 homolog n=1 Tax=Magnolia sinica TaxID=86752 RepID=UPI002658AA9D|nr:protein terminal ear1 homolog [Magnolia sinica]
MNRTGDRFPGILDPGAEEFRPQNQFALLQPQIYYPYPSSYPVSFYEGGGVGYQEPPPAHVRPAPTAAATRALLLSLVPAHVTESRVRMELEVFGEVRAVQMERLGEGIVTVHFYDLRDAQTALVEIQEQHMRQQSRLGQHYCSLVMGNWGCEGANSAVPMPLPLLGSRGLVGGQAVWAQFAVPAMIAEVADWQNQGTLVVFNLDSEVSSSNIKEIFEAFGPIKELRETPLKRQHRFVEFYDVRDAARALSEMNGKEIHGKRLVVEFSRPGGQGKRIAAAAAAASTPSSSSPSSNIYYRRNANYPPASLPLPPRLHGLSLDAFPRPPQTLQAMKRSIFGKGRASSPSSLASSSSRTAIEGEQDHPLRRNARKNPTNYPPSQPKPSARRSSSSKSHHQKKQADANFLFSEETISKDTRTTVMIKNIPNKYSQKLLLNMLDNHCIHCNEQIAEGEEEDEPLSAYDFVYLPIDFTNKCNVGYGFVNLTSPKAAWRLYKSFHLQAWEVFNSRKICQVTYARLQGLEALKEHFKNSKFACDTDEYLPVVFYPPRDGKQLTEPIAIGGHATKVKKTASGPGRRKKVDEQMDGGDSSTTTTSNQVEVGEDDDDADDGDESDGDEDGLPEVMLSSCSLSNEAQQQPKALSCAQVS